MGHLKSIVIILISSFFVNVTFSQENAIKITNPNSKKEIIIKESRRIRVITADGQRISGRLKILDEQNISVKNQSIPLDQIAKIKRNPLLLSIFMSSYFIYNGIVLVGISVLGYLFTGDPALFLITIPGAGLIWGGIKSPNPLKGYEKAKQWTYEVIRFSG